MLKQTFLPVITSSIHKYSQIYANPNSLTVLKQYTSNASICVRYYSNGSKRYEIYIDGLLCWYGSSILDVKKGKHQAIVKSLDFAILAAK